MSSNDYDICKGFTDMDDNILGTGIIENMEVAAMYSKPNVPLPKEERFKLMIIQSEIFVSMAKSNTDFFGRLRYLVCSFETSDVVFFPLPSRENNKVRTLIIRVSRPYDVTTFVNKMHIA